MATDMILPSNTPNVLHWSKDGGYSNNGSLSSYPRRMFDVFDTGLAVTMRLIKQDMDYICINSIHGFDIISSSPGEALKIRTYSTFRIPSGEEAIVTIQPKQYATSPDIQHYAPVERKCFYSYERQLRFFKFYAKRSCEAECLANFTKIQCNCVKFSMPSMFELNK